MEDTNLPEDRVKVVWEILPGEAEQLFTELREDDIDLSLLSPGTLVENENFPTIPYPALNPAEDYLDRVWAQSIIKVNYQPAEWFDENES